MLASVIAWSCVGLAVALVLCGLFQLVAYLADRLVGCLLALLACEVVDLYERPGDPAEGGDRTP